MAKGTGFLAERACGVASHRAQSMTQAVWGRCPILVQPPPQRRMRAWRRGGPVKWAAARRRWPGQLPGFAPEAAPAPGRRAGRDRVPGGLRHGRADRSRARVAAAAARWLALQPAHGLAGGARGCGCAAPQPSTLHCPFLRACMAAPPVAPLRRLTKTPACDVCCPMMSGWLRARGCAAARCHRAPSGCRSRQHLDPNRCLSAIGARAHARRQRQAVGHVRAVRAAGGGPAAARRVGGRARLPDRRRVRASDGSFVGVRRPGSGKPIEVRAPWRRCWRLAGVPVVVRSPCARMLSCDPPTVIGSMQEHDTEVLARHKRPDMKEPGGGGKWTGPLRWVPCRPKTCAMGAGGGDVAHGGRHRGQHRPGAQV